MRRSRRSPDRSAPRPTRWPWPGSSSAHPRSCRSRARRRWRTWRRTWPRPGLKLTPEQYATLDRLAKKKPAAR
jgi:hypothetical protein